MEDYGFPTRFKRNNESVVLSDQPYERRYGDDRAPGAAPKASQPRKRQTLHPALSSHLPDTLVDVDALADQEAEQEHGVQPAPSNAAPRSSPFDRIRDEVAASYIANLVQNIRAQQELVAGEALILERQAASLECACRSCSCTGPHSSSGVRAATVLVATAQSLHEIELQQLYCGSCKTAFLKRPTQLGCMPGSANAFSLARTSDQKPLWFHLSLLSFVDRSMYHAKSTSIYSVVEVLECRWLQAMEDEELLAMMKSLQQAAAPAAAPRPDPGHQVAEEPAGTPLQLPVTSDTMRRNLGAALQEYRCMLARCQRVTDEVPGWPLQQHQPCSACVPGKAHVHFDMCFGLRCLRRGGTASLEHPAPDNRRVFVANSRVQEGLGGVDAQQQQQQQSSSSTKAGPSLGADSSSSSKAVGGGEGTSPEKSQQDGTEIEGDPAYGCAGFQADKLIAKDSKKYLITGAGLAVCRHGHILMMMNAWTGERHAYAILCLHLLVLVYGLCIMFWWYDINCRWAASFRKWLQQQPEADQQKFAGMSFPVPPFHLYAHKEECRTRYGHLHMPQAGRGTGEKAEHANAVVGPHGKVTKYMSPINREAFLEHVVWLYTRSLDWKMSALLVHMVGVAGNELQACSREHAEEMAALHDACQDSPDVEARVRELLDQCKQDILRRLSTRNDYSDLGWEGRYVRARLLLERMQAVDGAASPFAPPSSLVFAGCKALSKVRISQSALAAAAATVAQLSRQHLAGVTPDISHPAMQAGISQWLAYEFKRGREQMATTLSHARYADSLVQRLQNKPEKKAVLERKAALVQKAVGLMKQLTEWACWAGQLAKGDAPVVKEWDPELAREIAAFAQATLEKLAESSCVLPWLPDAECGGAAERAAHKVFLLECLKDRLQEELQLLEEERAQLVTNIQTRVHVLDAAVAGSNLGLHEGRCYLLLQEGRRCKEMLARAQRQYSALQGGTDDASAELAAAAFVAVGCEGVVEADGHAAADDGEDGA